MMYTEDNPMNDNNNHFHGQISSGDSLPGAESHRHFHIKTWEVCVGGAALLAIGGFLIYSGDSFLPAPASRREYSQIATLVQDKISRSAPIVVRLPPGISIHSAEARGCITFDPPLNGNWSDGARDHELVFRPGAKLDIGTYYTVLLDHGGTKLQKDFYADDDPAVISVFPAADSESPETSDITIVFNRPMVPLTTLDALSDTDIPVEISPDTPGTFKWITTRNLQFIPEKRLFRSTRYTVTVREGFVSMDGLSVPGFTHSFTTRPLRYDGPRIHHDGPTLFSEPVRIRFNQPVNLERTKLFISVLNAKTNTAVLFVAEYGRRGVYDESSGTTKEYLDRSVIEIYGAHDSHGREKFWDFDTDYQFTISRAFPAEGDSELSEARSVFFHVPELISGMSADSPRSKYAEPDLFDPEGRLGVQFYEEIDKDNSRIIAKNLRTVEYGEKCRTDEDGNQIRVGSECEKERDSTRLYLQFNPEGFEIGENVPIEFQKIINSSGLVLNSEKITKNITIYPSLRITKTVPRGGDSGGKLTELKICSTNPLVPAHEENFKEQIISNKSVGMWNWYHPFRVGPGNPISPCAIGEFENTIQYGLVPESSYRITLNVGDDFGQTTQQTIEFKSGAVDRMYRRFSQLQKQYNVTSPDRTKLTYAVENLEYVNLHICEVSAITMLKYLDYGGHPDQTVPGENLSCIRSIIKQIELPKTYWTRNYFQVSVSDYIPNPLGHYILSFGHPEYREEQYDYRTQRYISGKPIYERTFVSVTNLAVQEKRIEQEASIDKFDSVTKDALQASGGNLYWVTRFGDLAPVAGARVDLYLRDTKGLHQVASGLTDMNGVARTSATSDSDAAIVTKENDTAIISSLFDKFRWAAPARSAERTYLYTDRPIYRPGQEVFIKGLYRIGYDGEYEIYNSQKAHVEIFNSKNESVLKQDLDVNDYGTFQTSFRLDSNAPLGTYRIQALGGIAYIDVEEYVPSPFKIKLTSKKDEYVAGDTMRLDVDAHYYFGVPVEGGEVEYSIISQNYYFDRYRDGYFQFGSGWYYSYTMPYGDAFILRGKTVLDADGRGKIEEHIDFDAFFKEDARNASKIFVVRITVKNSTGQSVSQEKSFIVHRGELYAGINLEKRFFGTDEPNLLRIKTVDTQGKEISAGNIRVEIHKISWESFRRQEVDGRYYWKSEKKIEPIESFSARTDANGNFSRKLTTGTEGEFEIVISTVDSRGNPIRSVVDFYVYGSGKVRVRPTNNETLDLAVEKNQVRAGDDVSVIIKSPFESAQALVAIERGKIFEYSIIDMNAGLNNFVFRVKEEYIPNVYFSVILLSPRPEVKYGQIHFSVNTDEEEISIKIIPDKNHYLPGEDVRLLVETADSRGRPVDAEVSIAVADVSVLALKGNPKKNPVAFFYAGLPLTVVTASNIKNILYEAEIPLGTKGGGGLEPEDLAKKKRGEFKDTAFWQGIVRTGEDGKTEIRFALPDNLTTWQTEAVGITKDTKVGVGYDEFTVRKKLMVSPLRPRFIVPGDSFMIGAKIFNQTGSHQTLDVSISSDTLDMTGDTHRSLSIGPEETETLYFAASAPPLIQNGEHRFAVSAKNDSYEDTVENAIAIKRNDTYEAMATAGTASNETTREYIFLPEGIVRDKGGVEIHTSATLAVFLSDALNYLVAYPYGCSEQIASKLASIATVKRGLSLKNIGEKFVLTDVEFQGQRYSIDDVVAIGLARIYSNQTPEGGFSYYSNLKPNFYLTLDILNALEDLRSAGYEVTQSAVDRAARYVFNEISYGLVGHDKNLVILTAYALHRIPGFQTETDILSKKITSIANDKKFIREDISNLSLAHMAILLTKGYPDSLKNEIFKTLENRISIDGRGSFLAPDKNQWLWNYYETLVKDTAMALKAFVADKRNYPRIDGLLRWILRSRSKDGAWGSTNNTLSVIDAFTDYLEWKRETESDFLLTLSMDGKERASFDFNADTILNTFDVFVSASEFIPNTLSIFDFQKKDRNEFANTLYYDMMLKYFLPIDSIPPRDEGFSLQRELYRLDDKEREHPLNEARVGDVLRGHLTIVAPKDRNFVSIEDFIPAGMELVNLKLATEDQSLRTHEQENPYFMNPYINEFYDGRGSVDVRPTAARLNGWAKLLSGIFSRFSHAAVFNWFGNFEGSSELDDDEYSPKTKALTFFADAEESHDDRLFLFRERLPAGVYEFDYFVRALIPGTFHHLPAVASEMYFPENFGRTRGEYFVIHQ